MAWCLTCYGLDNYIVLRPLPLYFLLSIHVFLSFFVARGSSFSLFPQSVYYQFYLSLSLYSRPLSVSSPPPICSSSLSSDCTNYFSPLLPPYRLLWPAHCTSLSFPYSLHPLLPLFVHCYHTYTIISPSSVCCMLDSGVQSFFFSCRSCDG